MLARIVDQLRALWRSEQKPLPAASPGTALEDLGLQLLAARPRRMKILEEIRDLMIGLPMQDRSALVDRVAARFAMYVVDLPASESNHGSEGFGLLDHSLDVARGAVGELVRPGFRVSEDPAMNYRDQPIWAYSGFVLGLLHDVGKVFDLEVQPRGEGATWNPLEEPLLAFLGRRRLAASGRESWRWKKGRGLNGHVWKGNALAPLILPASAITLLGRRLRVLLDTFVRSYAQGKEEWGKGPAGRVVQTVRDWDRMHAEENLKAGQELAVGNAPSGQTSAESTPSEAKAATSPPPASPSSSAPPASSPGSTSEKALQTVRQIEPTQDRKIQPVQPKQHVLEQRFAKDEARLRDELKPDRLIETIRSWVRAGKASRNGVHADLFVCPEHLWLRFPHALKGIVESINLKWNAHLGSNVLAALLKHPLVAPLSRTEVLVSATPTGRKEDLREFIRIRAAGFLPATELEMLGLWPAGMTLGSTVPPVEPSEGARLIGLRKAG